MPRSRRSIPCILVLTLGCGAAGDGGDWAGTIETLPDGAVRVTSPASGMWPEGGGWRLTPVLSLGRVEGDGPDVFSAISALEVGDDGRIYVLDRQTNELRIFGSDGAHIRTVGRSGAGPGEYANANGLAWIAPDSLLVVDQRGARYSVLTRDGEYARFVPRRLGFYGWVFSGAVHDGRVWEYFSVGQDEERRPALLGTALDAVATPQTQGEGPVLMAASDTVLLPEHDAPAFEAFSVRTPRGGMSMAVPFAPRSLHYLDPNGSLWHGHSSAYRLVRATLAGETEREILVGTAPTPVTDAEIAEFESSESVARFRDLGGRLDLDRIPRTKPFFDGLLAEPDGHLWVSVPGAPGESVFDILDPDGRYLGRLRLPGVTREFYLPPVIRGGRLHFVGRDELDVQRVLVYEVER